MLKNINFKLSCKNTIKKQFLSIYQENSYENELIDIFRTNSSSYIELMGKDNFYYYAQKIEPEIGNQRDAWFGRFGEFYSVKKILNICGGSNIIEIIPESSKKSERTPDIKLNNDLAIIEIYTPNYINPESFDGNLDIDLILRSPIKRFIEGEKRKIDQLTTYKYANLFKKKIGWVNTSFFKFTPLGIPTPPTENIWSELIKCDELHIILKSIYDCHVKTKLDSNTFIILCLPTFAEGLDIDYFIKFYNNGFDILTSAELKNTILEFSDNIEDELND